MARVIVADRVGPEVVPEVVPGAVRQAHATADAFLREARLQASELVRLAQQDAAVLIANARAEAVRQAREAAVGVALEASAARDQALADAQQQVIAIGVGVAEKLLESSLRTDPTLIEGVVQPLLARARRARRLELRLHPDDVSTLAPHITALETASGVGCPVRLEADASLRRGSCIVVSDLGVLDGSVETRLDLITRALQPLLARKAPQTDPAT